MGPMVWRGVTLASVALSGCASVPPATSALPLSVDNGRGSQHGNYVAQKTGEILGAASARCVAFEWDRPISATLAIRYTSASCPSEERPGWMVAIQISQTLVPLSKSHLAP